MTLQPPPVFYIAMGQFRVTDEPAEMRTVLGSCIACCIRDPIADIGGMNHFLLPGDIQSSDPTSQYGIFAMEFMINEILNMGGVKKRLEVKVFGGANVLESATKDIGKGNIEFIRGYLADEKLPIVSEDVGGFVPRKVCYFPHSGKVMMKRLESEKDKASNKVEKAVEEEKQYAKTHQGKFGDLGNKAEMFE